MQRPLWASTSTKNPAYPDTLYVDGLIGPDTINTLPEATIAAFEDHGTVARTIDADVEEAERRSTAWSRSASTWTTSARTLEDEGVASVHQELRRPPDNARGEDAELAAS